MEFHLGTGGFDCLYENESRSYCFSFESWLIEGKMTFDSGLFVIEFVHVNFQTNFLTPYFSATSLETFKSVINFFLLNNLVSDYDS